MWDRAYGNNLYVLFFLPFWKKWLKNYWHFVTGKTAKSILISCGARLAPFDIKELRDLTAYDELELDTLGEKKTALFVIISDTDATFNFIVKELLAKLAEYKPLAKIEEIEEQNYNMIDDRLNNGVEKFNREEEKKEQAEKPQARFSLKERLAAKQKEVAQGKKDSKEQNKNMVVIRCPFWLPFFY